MVPYKTPCRAGVGDGNVGGGDCKGGGGGVRGVEVWGGGILSGGAGEYEKMTSEHRLGGADGGALCLSGERKSVPD